MSTQEDVATSMRLLEELMLDKFETEPFHNLGLLYGERLRTTVPGGTCSDKTLSFLRAAKCAGFDVGLHSGFIGGQEIHRLARVRIDDRVFFADVGNGWPALKLYPADREVAFSCFGMCFRTEIEGQRIRVFHERKGREALQLEIDVHGRPEREIRGDIARRFSSGVVYPFSNSLRFSRVIGERFLFLRGDRLEIYSNNSYEELGDIKPADVSTVISEYFGLVIDL